MQINDNYKHFEIGPVSISVSEKCYNLFLVRYKQLSKE